MTVFARIVVGVDPSPPGLETLRRVRPLLAPGGRLVAVTVFDPAAAAQTGWDAGAIAAQLEEEGRRVRDEAAGELEGLDGEALLVRGSPGGALLEVAGRERATLVAVGGHGQRRAAGILLGGVAARLLHESPLPVLVVRPPLGRERFPRAILVGLDGSPPSVEAAGVARELARRFGVPLRALVATGGKPVDADALTGAVAGAGASAAPLPELEWSDRKPVEALVRAGADVDLLAVGSRGLHGVAALGSVSERVAHRAPCSVLVVRPAL